MGRRDQVAELFAKDPGAHLLNGAAL